MFPWGGRKCVWSYLLFCKLLPLWLRKLRRRHNPRCRDRRRRDSEPPPWLSQQFCWGRRDWGGGPSWKRTTADLAQAVLGRGGVVTILGLSIVKGIYFRLEIYQALLRWIALFHVFSQSLKWNCWNSHFNSFLHAWMPFTFGTLSRSRVHESKWNQL